MFVGSFGDLDGRRKCSKMLMTSLRFIGRSFALNGRIPLFSSFSSSSSSDIIIIIIIVSIVVITI